LHIKKPQKDLRTKHYFELRLNFNLDRKKPAGIGLAVVYKASFSTIKIHNYWIC